MIMLLTYQGTVVLGQQNLAVAGYNLGDDHAKLSQWMDMLLDGMMIDSISNSPDQSSLAVQLSIEVAPLSMPQKPSGSNGNAASSHAPTTTPSAKPIQPSGTGSQPKAGQTAGSGHPAR
jgi:hypothetical protein